MLPRQFLEQCTSTDITQQMAYDCINNAEFMQGFYIRHPDSVPTYLKDRQLAELRKNLGLPQNDKVKSIMQQFEEKVKNGRPRKSSS